LIYKFIYHLTEGLISVEGRL